MHRKNAEIAEDEVDASDIAAIRYVEDLALLICLAAFTVIWYVEDLALLICLAAFTVICKNC